MPTREVIDACDSITDWSTSQATDFTLSLDTTVETEGTGCLKIVANTNSLAESVINSSLGGIEITEDDTVRFKVRSTKTGTKMRCYLKNDNPVLVEDGSVYGSGSFADDTNDWEVVLSTYGRLYTSGDYIYAKNNSGGSGTATMTKEFTACKSGSFECFHLPSENGTGATSLNYYLYEGVSAKKQILNARNPTNTGQYIRDMSQGSTYTLNSSRAWARSKVIWFEDDTYELWGATNDADLTLRYSGTLNSGMTNGIDKIVLVFSGGTSGVGNTHYGTHFNLDISGVGDTSSIYQDITIASTDTWETVEFDISGWDDAKKDNIQGIIFQCIDASESFDFYIDDLRVYYPLEFTDQCITTIVEDDFHTISDCVVSGGNVELGYDSDYGDWSANLMTNPDAETGDITGWTNSSNFQVTTKTKRTGSYAFGKPHDVKSFKGYQDIDVSGYAVEIANGALQAGTYVWQVCTDPWNDSQRSTIEYRDVSGNVLRTKTIGWYHGYNKTWTKRGEAITVPVGTDHIRLILEGKIKFGGSDPGVFFDDAECKVRIKDRPLTGYVMIEKDFEGGSVLGDLTYTESGTGTITVKAQTSEDGKKWVAWSTLSDIASGSDLDSESSVTQGHQYLRIRVDLTTADVAVTPVLEELCYEYYVINNTCPCSAKFLNDSVILTWTDNEDNEDGYQVYRKEDGGDWSLLTTTGPGVVTYEDTTVDFGSIYEYRIRTFIGTFYSSWCYTESIDLTRKKHIIFAVEDEIREFYEADGSTALLNYYDAGTVKVTNGSATVYSDGTDISDCETNWTAEANVASALDSGDKQEGSNSVELTVDAAAGVQVLAYSNLAASVDCSDLQALHFWIKSSVDTDAGDFLIKLYDTATKTNEVVRFPVPALTATTWTKVYIQATIYDEDNDISDINCISIDQVVDKGACVINVDNFMMIEQEWTGNVKAGDKFSIDDSTWYTVDSVDSLGEITLTAVYAGTTATEQSYYVKFPYTENTPFDYATANNKFVGTNFVQYPWEYDGDKFHRQLVDDVISNSGITIAEDTAGTLAAGVYRYKFAYQSNSANTTQATEYVEITNTGGKQHIITGLPRPTWRYDYIKVFRTPVDETVDYKYCKKIDARATATTDAVEDADLDANEYAKTTGNEQFYCRYIKEFNNRLVAEHITINSSEQRSQMRYSELAENNSWNGTSYEPMHTGDGDQINGLMSNWLDAFWTFKERTVLATEGTNPDDWGAYITHAFLGTKSFRSIVVGDDSRIYYLDLNGHIRRLVGIQGDQGTTADNVQTDELTNIIKPWVEENVDPTKLYMASGINYKGKIIQSIASYDSAIPNWCIIYDYKAVPEKVYLWRVGITSFLLTDEGNLYGTEGTNKYLYQLDVEDLYTDDTIQINCTYKGPALTITPGNETILSNVKVQYDSESDGEAVVRLYNDGTLIDTVTRDLSVYTDRLGINPNRRNMRGLNQQIQIDETSDNPFVITNIQLQYLLRAKSAV